MIVFIELTNAKEGNKQMINVGLVESFTELENGTLVHFKSNSAVTIRESLKIVKRKIQTA